MTSHPTSDLNMVSVTTHNGQLIGTTKDNKAWRFDPSKGRWVPLQHEWKPEKIHTY